MKNQRKGIFKDVCKNLTEFISEKKILNFIHPDIEIKMTKDKGRGIFAAKDLMKGDLLLVDTAIVET